MSSTKWSFSMTWFFKVIITVALLVAAPTLTFAGNWNQPKKDASKKQKGDNYGDLSAYSKPMTCEESSELQRSDQCRKTREYKTKYTGKIFDSHSHPRPKGNPRHHVGELEENGVTKLYMQDTPNTYKDKKNKEWRVRTKIANHYDGGNLCGGKITGFLSHGKKDQAKKNLAEIKELISSRECIGIGEIGVRHYDKGCNAGAAQPESVLKNLNDPILRELLAVANENAMPVFFHYEPSKCNKQHDQTTVIKFYEKVCKDFPKAKILASHTGMLQPSELEQVLKSCDNAYSDIKPIMKPLGWQGLEPANNVEMRLFEDFAQLIEKYPDRFLIGSDWKDGHPYYADRPFSDHFNSIREMIGSLEPSVQEAVAYKNCERIMKR
jgi:predicted TIM-barrel fold metal-dependent hydrolase